MPGQGLFLRKGNPLKQKHTTSGVNEIRRGEGMLSLILWQRNVSEP